MTDFPRQLARTRRFSLGVPRAVKVLADFSGVLFLRSATGSDPYTMLWLAQLRTDGMLRERCLVDPREFAVASDAIPPAERALRERAREQATGVTSFATDASGCLIAFTLSGELYTYDLTTSKAVRHATASGAYDPRPSPDGTKVAYVAGGALHVIDLATAAPDVLTSRVLIEESSVSWGSAEFVAAEEMGRTRGYWWSPDSRRITACRVDERAVPIWTIADPAAPWTPGGNHRYPAAGTANADVQLAVVSLDGSRVDIDWDRSQLPYLTRVGWDTDGANHERLTLQVQDRGQRTLRIVTANPDSGAIRVQRTIQRGDWVELAAGSPAWSGDDLVTVEDLDEHGAGGSRALMVNGQPVTPEGMQVRRVVTADTEAVVFCASHADPSSVGTYRWTRADLTELSGGPAEMASTLAVGPVTVTTTHRLDAARPRVEVQWRAGDRSFTSEIAVLSEIPKVSARPRLLELGSNRLRAALLLPSDDEGAGSLPVVLDPYGGPHVQRVVANYLAFVTPQWIADQGFAVLVTDGRGSPGRGPQWERALAGDLASIPLHDQLEALEQAARMEPRLDLDRVGIRGWSFGGFLAALAALRAPESIRVAVAGAPVTDWQLYDTHYTERYLGMPQEAPEAYAVSSLVDTDGGLPGAVDWPETDYPELLLMHGLADDNVVAAHSLRLSAALLASGRRHRFLPLAGVTHMTPQEDIAEQLLLLQVDLLRDVLLAAPRAAGQRI